MSELLTLGVEVKTRGLKRCVGKAACQRVGQALCEQMEKKDLSGLRWPGVHIFSAPSALVEGRLLMTVSLGFTQGQIVQEFYVDEDADQGIRDSIESETGEEIVDEDYGDVVDGAIVWWRSEDAEEEDLADLLVDAMSNLDDGGLIWVLIPKPGRTGFLPVADVEDAAKVAGLHSTSAASLGSDWAGIRLTARPRTR